jgi:hypothetical protein
LSGLEIASGDLSGFGNDFKFSNEYSGNYTYDQVGIFTSENPKWRLPKVDEMITMAQNKNSLKMNGEFYLCYGFSKGYKLPDNFPNKSIFTNYQNFCYVVNIKSLENGYPFFMQSTLNSSHQSTANIRLVKSNSKLNIKSPNEKVSFSESSKINNIGKRITTYSGSYGFYGSTLNSHDIQFQLECSAPFNVKRLSSGIKWRYFLNEYSGLNVEGFGRIYLGKESKMINSNDRFYMQTKLGYGLLKSLEDSFTSQFAFRQKSTFSSLAGLGVGYKFLIKDRISFDFLIGYHYQTTPAFSSSDENYTNHLKSKWKEYIAYPIDIQWSIGFQIK